jgi:hypothetical protein
MLSDRPFVITAWSGSFALRVLYDILKRRPGARAGGKPFLAEPVRIGAQPLLTGIHLGSPSSPRPHPSLCWREVEAGTPLTFTYHFSDEELARTLVELLAEGPVVEEPACRLSLTTLSAAQLELARAAIPLNKVLSFAHGQRRKPSAGQSSLCGRSGRSLIGGPRAARRMTRTSFGLAVAGGAVADPRPVPGEAADA